MYASRRWVCTIFLLMHTLIFSVYTYMRALTSQSVHAVGPLVTKASASLDELTAPLRDLVHGLHDVCGPYVGVFVGCVALWALGFGIHMSFGLCVAACRWCMGLNLASAWQAVSHLGHGWVSLWKATWTMLWDGLRRFFFGGGGAAGGVAAMAIVGVTSRGEALHVDLAPLLVHFATAVQLPFEHGVVFYRLFAEATPSTHAVFDLFDATSTVWNAGEGLPVDIVPTARDASSDGASLALETPDPVAGRSRGRGLTLGGIALAGLSVVLWALRAHGMST